jgi:small GTP-binding protein
MSDNIKKNIYNIKIILLGESGVGKTNLINAYFGNPFNTDISMTTTPNQSHSKVDIENNICYLDIWDTMGQEKYHSMTKSFIKGSHIIIFVYDMTDKESFTKLNYWVNQVREVIDLDNKIILGLAANKLDLIEECQVEKNQGEAYAKKIGAIFGEMSAKENRKVFKQYVHKLLGKLLDSEDSIEKEGNIIERSRDSINTGSRKKKKTKVCC